MTENADDVLLVEEHGAVRLLTLNRPDAFNATNEVLVGDGETAVIAGLTQTQVTRSRSGIPYLMDIPFIGRLFAQTRVAERKQDLLILVTPHIVDEGEVVRSVRP